MVVRVRRLDRLPLHESDVIRGQRPDSGFEPVGHDEHLVEREERGNFGLVNSVAV